MVPLVAEQESPLLRWIREELNFNFFFDPIDLISRAARAGNIEQLRYLIELPESKAIILEHITPADARAGRLTMARPLSDLLVAVGRTGPLKVAEVVLEGLLKVKDSIKRSIITSFLYGASRAGNVLMLEQLRPLAEGHFFLDQMTMMVLASCNRDAVDTVDRLYGPHSWKSFTFINVLDPAVPQSEALATCQWLLGQGKLFGEGALPGAFKARHGQLAILLLDSGCTLPTSTREMMQDFTTEVRPL